MVKILREAAKEMSQKFQERDWAETSRRGNTGVGDGCLLGLNMDPALILVNGFESLFLSPKPPVCFGWIGLFLTVSGCSHSRVSIILINK